MSSTEMKLEVDHSIRIRKPAAEVFEAIVSPEHLNRYFTSRAEGRLEKGSKVTWQWTDYPEKVPVDVIESIPSKRLVFQWPTHDKLYKTTVQFDLEDQQEKGTIVRVREGIWKTDAAGLTNSYDNSGGWMHMLCCLKAYLDFDVDLRSKPVPENWKA
jgi:uncharacterized protein YndB with AHSA1/START domain